MSRHSRYLLPAFSAMVLVGTLVASVTSSVAGPDVGGTQNATSIAGVGSYRFCSNSLASLQFSSSRLDVTKVDARKIAAGPYAFNDGTIRLSAEMFAAMTTYAGPYLVNGGTLAFNTSAGTMTSAFAKLLAVHAGTVDAGSGTLSGTMAGNLDLSAVSLAKAGCGSLTLANANIYSGTTSLNIGSLTATGGTSIVGGLPTVNRLTSAINTQGGTLRLNTGTTAGTTSGNVTLSGSTDYAMSTGTTTRISNGQLHFSGTQSGAVYSSPVTLNTTTLNAGTVIGNVNLAGSGTLTTSGVNTYSGGTPVNSGSLIVTNQTSAGTDEISFNRAITSTSIQGGTLRLNTGTIANTTSGIVASSGSYGAFTLAGDGAVNLNREYSSTGIQGGLLQLGGGQLVYRDPLSFNSAATSSDAIAGTMCLPEDVLFGSGQLDSQGTILSSASALVHKGAGLGYGTLKINAQNALTASASTLTLQASPNLVSLDGAEQRSVFDLNGSNTLRLSHPITPILGNPLRITNENVAFAGKLNVGNGQVFTVNGNALASDGGGTAVPEPGTLLLTLVAAALAGLAWLRRPGK